MTTTHESPPLSTLVVDDHPAQRLFLDRMLRLAGYIPRIACDGNEALSAIETRMPDILFIDWMMPGLNGLELTRDIRRRAGGERCYVIMLTSKASADDLAAAFDAGVDDYMTKPVGAVELHARLKAAVRLTTLGRTLSERVTEVSILNTGLVELNTQLEELASTDGLTGLLNRRAGMQRLTDAWSAAERYATPLSVAIVDIDNFKRVNDEFGHARGDAAIRHVASVLRDQAREGDAVARFGGEEFIVVMPRADSGEASNVMERARQRVERARCQADGREVLLSISVGIAERGLEMSGNEALLASADRMLYEAKANGRNRVQVADRRLVARQAA